MSLGTSRVGGNMGSCPPNQGPEVDNMEKLPGIDLIGKEVVGALVTGSLHLIVN